MRKLTVLILAVVLCFGATACSIVPDKNENQGNTTEGISILEELVGEWFGWGWNTDPEDLHTLQLTLNADGTCVYNGIAGTWGEGDMGEMKISGAFGSHICYVQTMKNSERQYILVGGPENELYRASEYTKVELTMDNWQQYLATSYTNATFSKNAFGDITDVSVKSSIGIKDTYRVGLIDPMERPAAEITYVYDRYQCAVDMVTGQVVLGEKVVWGEAPFTGIFTLGWGGENPTLHTHTGGVSPYPVGEVSLLADFTVSRIQGTIYILND